jgi:hypothetical protein
MKWIQKQKLANYVKKFSPRQSFISRVNIIQVIANRVTQSEFVSGMRITKKEMQRTTEDGSPKIKREVSIPISCIGKAIIKSMQRLVQYGVTSTETRKGNIAKQTELSVNNMTWRDGQESLEFLTRTLIANLFLKETAAYVIYADYQWNQSYGN